MLLALLAAAAQEPAPERFSILVPVPPQKCAPRQMREGEEGQEGDVVVCAKDLPDQTIPYPAEYVYDGPRPSNPKVTGAAAMAAEATPCAASQSGCQVGFGQPIVAAAVKGLVNLIQDATAKKPDKRGRVPIDISEPAKP